MTEIEKEEPVSDSTSAPGLEIRTAAEADLPRVASILHEVGLNGELTLPVLHRMLEISDDLMLVAENEEEVVGVLIASFNGRTVWVSHLAISRAAHRTGIGGRLLRRLETRARARGALRVMIDAWEDAVGFYSRKHYHDSGYTLLFKHASAIDD